LKHHFFYFTQVAFWAGQDAENGFAVPGDHLNHRFLNRTEVAFCAGQVAEKDF